MSLGLVQHHFETKAGLIKAVDDYVMSVVIEVVAKPASAPPIDSVADMGSRITTLLSEHSEVVDYFGRALVDGSPLGMTIFDTLSAFGTARWNQRKDNGELREDIDLTWATLNSLVLFPGHPYPARTYRTAADERLQYARAASAMANFVTALLRDGLFRQPDGDTGS